MGNLNSNRDNTHLWLQKSPIGKIINNLLILPVVLKVRWWLLKADLIHSLTGQEVLRALGVLRFETYDDLWTHPKYTEKDRIKNEQSATLKMFQDECANLEEYYERTGH